MSTFPYEDRFEVHRRLPESGTPRRELLAELHAMAKEEDATWESGKCSGTMYCGDHDHYRFLNEAFGLFAHVNVLQRDMCPSATKFEAEIIAMTLDLLHAEAVTEAEPVGLIATGGTGSICHAMLAYREYGAQQRGSPGPTSSSRRPPIRRSTRRAISSASSCGRPRSIRSPPRSTPAGWMHTSTRTPWPSSARRATTGTAPSTPSPPSPTSPWPTGWGCTWTAAWADSSSPSARSWATTSRCSTTASPG